MVPVSDRIHFPTIKRGREGGDIPVLECADRLRASLDYTSAAGVIAQRRAPSRARPTDQPGPHTHTPIPPSPAESWSTAVVTLPARSAQPGLLMCLLPLPARGPQRPGALPGRSGRAGLAPESQARLARRKAARRSPARSLITHPSRARAYPFPPPYFWRSEGRAQVTKPRAGSGCGVSARWTRRRGSGIGPTGQTQVAT